MPDTATATEALQAQRAGEREPAHAVDLEQRRAGPTAARAAEPSGGVHADVLDFYLQGLRKQGEVKAKLMQEVILPGFQRHMDLWEQALGRAMGREPPTKALATLREQAEAHLKALSEPVPASTPLPEPPSLRPRPFLDPEGRQALGRVISALGLMATMAAGLAGGAPVAALQALTGAMQGWQEGDHARAEGQWREYLAKVDRIKAENDRIWKTYAAAMEASRGRVQAAQTILAAELAAQGQDDRLVRLAGQNLEGFLKQAQMLERMTTDLAGDSKSLAMMWLRVQNAQDVERHRRVMEMIQLRMLGLREQEVGLSVEQRREALKAKETANKLAILAIDRSLSDIQTLRRDIETLERHGLLRLNMSLPETIAVWSRRKASLSGEAFQALDRVTRWMTAMIVGREIEQQAGRVAALRFRGIAETEAGSVDWSHPDFLRWFLDTYERWLRAAKAIRQQGKDPDEAWVEASEPQLIREIEGSESLQERILERAGLRGRR